MNYLGIHRAWILCDGLSSPKCGRGGGGGLRGLSSTAQAPPATDCCLNQASPIAERQAAQVLEAVTARVPSCCPLVTFIYANGLEQPATQVEMGWEQLGFELWPVHNLANLVT